MHSLSDAYFSEKNLQRKQSDLNKINYTQHIHGLVQDCGNSIASVMELPQSCTKLLIYNQACSETFWMIGTSQFFYDYTSDLWTGLSLIGNKIHLFTILQAYYALNPIPTSLKLNVKVELVPNLSQQKNCLCKIHPTNEFGSMYFYTFKGRMLTELMPWIWILILKSWHAIHSTIEKLACHFLPVSSPAGPGLAAWPWGQVAGLKVRPPGKRSGQRSPWQQLSSPWRRLETHFLDQVDIDMWDQQINTL